MFWPELNSRLLQRENGREQGRGGVRRKTFLGVQRSESKPSGAPALAKAAGEPPALSTGTPTLTQLFGLVRQQFPEGSVSSSLKCLKTSQHCASPVNPSTKHQPAFLKEVSEIWGVRASLSCCSRLWANLSPEITSMPRMPR